MTTTTSMRYVINLNDCRWMNRGSKFSYFLIQKTIQQRQQRKTTAPTKRGLAEACMRIFFKSRSFDLHNSWFNDVYYISLHSFHLFFSYLLFDTHTISNMFHWNLLWWTISLSISACSVARTDKRWNVQRTHFILSNT